MLRLRALLAPAALCVLLTACSAGEQVYPGDTGLPMRQGQQETALDTYSAKNSRSMLEVYGRETTGIRLEKNRQNPPLCQSKVGEDYYGRPTQRCTDRRDRPFMGE